MFTLLETYDLFRFTEPFSERLDALSAELDAREGFLREKMWMGMARDLVAEARGAALELLPRLRALPEMGAAREEHAVAQIGPWVDALEKLLAGITFHFGSRAPVIEALYPHLKLPLLRRPNLDEARAYWAEFERRLRSSYVERIFAQEDWSFVRDVVAHVRAAWAPIAEVQLGGSGTEADHRATAEAALAQAEAVDRALAQARLIVEAALLPFDGVFAGSGLAAKPKRRGAAARGAKTAELAESPRASGPASATTGEGAPDRPAPSPGALHDFPHSAPPAIQHEVPHDVVPGASLGHADIAEAGDLMDASDAEDTHEAAEALFPPVEDGETLLPEPLDDDEASSGDPAALRAAEVPVEGSAARGEPAEAPEASPAPRRRGNGSRRSRHALEPATPPAEEQPAQFVNFPPVVAPEAGETSAPPPSRRRVKAAPSDAQSARPAKDKARGQSSAPREAKDTNPPKTEPEHRRPAARTAKRTTPAKAESERPRPARDEAKNTKSAKAESERPRPARDEAKTAKTAKTGAKSRKAAEAEPKGTRAEAQNRSAAEKEALAPPQAEAKRTKAEAQNRSATKKRTEAPPEDEARSTKPTEAATPLARRAHRRAHRRAAAETAQDEA